MILRLLGCVAVRCHSCGIDNLSRRDLSLERCWACGESPWPPPLGVTITADTSALDAAFAGIASGTRRWAEASPSSVLDDIKKARSLIADSPPPEPVKLTAAEWEWLKHPPDQ